MTGFRLFTISIEKNDVDGISDIFTCNTTVAMMISKKISIMNNNLRKKKLENIYSMNKIVVGEILFRLPTFYGIKYHNSVCGAYNGFV